jgi:hypothetical protein
MRPPLPAVDDTSTDARRVLTQQYARMSPAEKLRRVDELTRTVGTLALAGLRTRHPGESERDLLIRLARIRLGDALMAQAYGLRSRNVP